MVSLAFPRELRILAPAEFDRVFANPIKAASPTLTILATPNGKEFPRLGLIVPKKALKRAVWRNRVKRLIRTRFRIDQHNLEKLDYVFIAKFGIGDVSNKDIDKLIFKLCQVISRRYKKQASDSSSHIKNH